MEVLRADPLVGVVLDGRYQVLSTVARGGMATVYRARDLRLERDVAVKAMHPFLADNPDFVDRFTREARAAARISDRHVVAVHDQGTDRETRTVYLVMELVRGRTLRALLDERGRLTPAEALSILEPVAAAMAAAHASGVVHRDVKPENVLLGDDGRVLVADFGLARAVTATSATANAGLLIGTVAYLSPEQVRDGSADPRSDVYSSGILLFELLTGRVPYTGDSPLSVAYRHLHEDVPPSGTGTGIDNLLAAMTSRDPSVRPADGAALLDLVRSLRRATPAQSSPQEPRNPTKVLENPRVAGVTPGGTDVIAVTPPPATVARTSVTVREPAVRGKLTRRNRRRRALIVFLVVLLLSAGAGFGGWWFGSGRYTQTPKLLGLDAAHARTAAAAAHLTLKTLPAENSDTVPVGQVVEQSPGAQQRIVRGHDVSVALSLGPAMDKVPVIAAGITPDAARNLLNQAGLSIGVSKRQTSLTVPSGKVIQSVVAAGTSLKHGTRVDIVVSSGLPSVDVPDLTGKSAKDAVSALAAAHLTGSPSNENSDTVPVGQVIDQGTSGTALYGSTVTYHLSTGPKMVQVPDFHGLSRGAAQTLAAQSDVTLNIYDLPDGFGTVVGQSPHPGDTVKHGSTVDIEID